MNIIKCVCLGLTVLVGAAITAFTLWWSWISSIQIPGVLTNPLQSYDFIVVGAGTCGCVMASILSSDQDKTVLLIEAGGEFGFLSTVPLAATLMQGSDVDYAFKTEPQKYSSAGLFEQRQSWPRGKGLGGSGQLNYMLHATGLPEDFDRWGSLGATDWTYRHMEPFLKQMTSQKELDGIVDHEEELVNESCKKNSLFLHEEQDGFIDFQCSQDLSGPKIPIEKAPVDESELTKAFLNSQSELNIDRLVFKQTEHTIKNGERWSSFIGYLRPVLGRRNLHVMLNSMVRKIHFNMHTKHASHVEVVVSNKGIIKIEATREIILSLGSIRTPQLLMTSGVGPEKKLLDLGIDPVLNSPGVGSNLHDNLNMPVYVSITEPVSVTMDKMLNAREVMDYLFNRKGVWSSTAILRTGSGPDPKMAVEDHTMDKMLNAREVMDYLFNRKGVWSSTAILRTGSGPDPKMAVEDHTMDKMLNAREVMDYLFNRKGVWSSTAILGTGSGPDHVGFVLFGMGSADEQALRDIANFIPETFRGLFPMSHNTSQEGFIFLSTCLQPASRGKISLFDGKMESKPKIDPNYLVDDSDLACMLKALKVVHATVLTPSFQRLGAQLQWPILPQCSHLSAGPLNDQYLECIIRTAALASHHPGGTCAIGNGTNSVVDNQLRVRGISGLRIMDASVLPAPISGTPNSVLIAMTEKAARMILKAHRNRG